MGRAMEVEELVDEVELAGSKKWPRCVCCSKQSDAANEVHPDVWLCGTCWDNWGQSAEVKRARAFRDDASEEANDPLERCFMDWLVRRQAERRNGTVRP